MERSKDFNYLFNDVPLYTKEIFHPFELKDGKYHLNETEMNKFCAYIYNNRLIAYCHKCKKEFPFDVRYNVRNNNYHRDNLMITQSDGSIFGCSLDITNGHLYGVQPPFDSQMLQERIYYIEYLFNCTNDKNHQYIMYISVEIKKDGFVVRKIGQNPSMLTIKGFDFDKYKKELEALNAYEDYKKADLSYADHFYVGSFAYLRRIFEKMLEEYTEGKALVDNHVDTKINVAKEKFDPRIRDLLKNMYGILSASIHELDEETSKDYYISLKAIIDIQLEYLKTEKDKEKQSKELSSVLGKIASGLFKSKNKTKKES